MRIFLTRHGQSEANVDKTILAKRPDHDIGLSRLGVDEAKAAGEFLAGYLDKLRVDTLGRNRVLRVRAWNSPYERTRQTAGHMMNEIDDRRLLLRIDQREDVSLCEQQFGLFDGYTDEQLPEAFPQEYAHYKKCEDFGGKFWARTPLGESRFDVTLRVRQMFGTLVRDAEKHDIDNVVLVTHGVTMRAFIMQWCRKSWEWFEKEPNAQNCAIYALESHGVDKGYIYKGPKT